MHACTHSTYAQCIHHTYSIQVDADDVWGWMIYTILVGSFFAFIKSINYRLHKLFGTDPLILKEEETSKEEQKQEDTADTEADNKDKEKTTDEGDASWSPLAVPSASGIDVKPYPTKTDELQKDIDVNIEIHRSASSLNSTTDRTSMDTSGGTLEMSRRSSGSRRPSRKSSPKLESRNITAATSGGVVEVTIAEVVCNYRA